MAEETLILRGIWQGEKLIDGIKTLSRETKTIQGNFKTTVKEFKQVNESGKQVGKSWTKITSNFRHFRMELLSVMFGAMMIKRTFQNIAKVGVDTFTRIMEASNLHNSALQQAQLWWEYLRFSIGSALNTALMPLMPILISIVSKFAEFVQTHPELTFWSIVGAVTAAGLLTSLASIGLFLDGLKNFAVSAGFTKLFGAGGTMWRIAGTTFAAYFAFKEAVGAYDAFKKDNIRNGIIKTLSSASFAAGGIALATGNLAVGGALLAVGVGLEWLSQDVFFSNLFNIFGIVGGFINGFVAATILQLVKFAENQINTFSSVIHDLLQILNPTMTIPSIPKVHLMPSGYTGDFGTDFTKIFKDFYASNQKAGSMLDLWFKNLTTPESEKLFAGYGGEENFYDMLNKQDAENMKFYQDYLKQQNMQGGVGPININVSVSKPDINEVSNLVQMKILQDARLHSVLGG